MVVAAAANHLGHFTISRKVGTKIMESTNHAAASMPEPQHTINQNLGKGNLFLLQSCGKCGVTFKWGKVYHVNSDKL